MLNLGAGGGGSGRGVLIRFVRELLWGMSGCKALGCTVISLEGSFTVHCENVNILCSSIHSSNFINKQYQFANVGLISFNFHLIELLRGS